MNRDIEKVFYLYKDFSGNVLTSENASGTEYWTFDQIPYTEIGELRIVAQDVYGTNMVEFSFQENASTKNREKIFSKPSSGI